MLLFVRDSVCFKCLFCCNFCLCQAIYTNLLIHTLFLFGINLVTMNLVNLPHSTVNYADFDSAYTCVGCNTHKDGDSAGISILPRNPAAGITYPVCQFCYNCCAAIAVTASEMPEANPKFVFVFSIILSILFMKIRK